MVYAIFTEKGDRIYNSPVSGLAIFPNVTQAVDFYNTLTKRVQMDYKVAPCVLNVSEIKLEYTS